MVTTFCNFLYICTMKWKIITFGLFNGFQKKSQKIPSGEIAKALKVKEEYYEYKRNNASGL